MNDIEDLQPHGIASARMAVVVLAAVVMALSSCSGSDVSDRAVEGSRWASVEEMAEMLQSYPHMPKDERDRLTAEMLQEAGGDFA